jgi:hypothetical protein
MCRSHRHRRPAAVWDSDARRSAWPSARRRCWVREHRSVLGVSVDADADCDTRSVLYPWTRRCRMRDRGPRRAGGRYLFRGRNDPTVAASDGRGVLLFSCNPYRDTNAAAPDPDARSGRSDHPRLSGVHSHGRDHRRHALRDPRCSVYADPDSSTALTRFSNLDTSPECPN